jgi:hypothetical protein
MKKLLIKLGNFQHKFWKTFRIKKLIKYFFNSNIELVVLSSFFMGKIGMGFWSFPFVKASLKKLLKKSS